MNADGDITFQDQPLRMQIIRRFAQLPVQMKLDETMQRNFITGGGIVRRERADLFRAS